VFVCHRRADGTFKTIKVGTKAYSKHIGSTKTHSGDSVGICYAGDDLKCY
jgi:hypothetical protein